MVIRIVAAPARSIQSGLRLKPDALFPLHVLIRELSLEVWPCMEKLTRVFRRPLVSNFRTRVPNRIETIQFQTSGIALRPCGNICVVLYLTSDHNVGLGIGEFAGAEELPVATRREDGDGNWKRIAVPDDE
jgi:hypothetical protein